MSTTSRTRLLDSGEAPATYGRRLRALAGLGVMGAVATAAATTLTAAAASAVGVDFEIPDGGESIPLSGIAFVTVVFCLVGAVLAAALLRWSARPARRFLWTAGLLTAVSLIPPMVSGAAASTVAALIVLHLVAAAVMIPVLTNSLRSVADEVA